MKKLAMIALMMVLVLSGCASSCLKNFGGPLWEQVKEGWADYRRDPAGPLWEQAKEGWADYRRDPAGPFWEQVKEGWADYCN